MCCCKCLVEKHAQNLPTSFAAISKYPLEYRKAIFINLTPKQKVNVWTDRPDPEVEDVWLKEIQHRENKYKEGKAILISGEEVISGIRERLAK